MLPFLWYLLALVKLQIETVCFIVHRNWTLSNPNDLSLYQACATLGSMCRDLEKQIHAVLVPRSIIPGWLCTQLITTKGITNSWCGQSAQSWFYLVGNSIWLEFILYRRNSPGQSDNTKCTFTIDRPCWVISLCHGRKRPNNVCSVPLRSPNSATPGYSLQKCV